MKTLKTTKQLIKELEEEIKVTEKCMKDYAKTEQFDMALENKNTIMTLHFVIALAKGELD
jgi:excinuclease UvrABC helicase subunit UvrB